MNKMPAWSLIRHKDQLGCPIPLHASQLFRLAREMEIVTINYQQVARRGRLQRKPLTTPKDPGLTLPSWHFLNKAKGKIRVAHEYNAQFHNIILGQFCFVTFRGRHSTRLEKFPLELHPRTWSGRRLEGREGVLTHLSSQTPQLLHKGGGGHKTYLGTEILHSD